MSDAASPSTLLPRSKRAAVFIRRLASTLALWAVVVTVVLTADRWLFFGLLAVFGGAALVEWRRMFALPGPCAAWLYVVSAGYAVTLIWTPSSATTPVPVEAVAFPVLLLGLFVLAMRHGLDGRETLWRIFAAAIGFIYVVVLFSFVWRLLQLPHDPGVGRMPGVFFAVHVIAVTKFTDTGAYVFGMLLGRHKMIPHISPGKTWEGFAGGFIGAFIASHSVVALWPEKAPINHIHAAVLAASLAVVTVAADLAESVIKRCVGTKDSGKLLPGIGGALDLIDSLLFTAPVAWVYLRLVAA